MSLIMTKRGWRQLRGLRGRGPYIGPPTFKEHLIPPVYVKTWLEENGLIAGTAAAVEEQYRLAIRRYCMPAGHPASIPYKRLHAVMSSRNPDQAFLDETYQLARVIIPETADA